MHTKRFILELTGDDATRYRLAPAAEAEHIRQALIGVASYITEGSVPHVAVIPMQASATDAGDRHHQKCECEICLAARARAAAINAWPNA